MADDTRTTTPEDPLAWEARNARRAGFAAIGAAVCTVVGAITGALAQSGAPKADERVLTIVDTLGRTAAGQPIPPGHQAAVADYLGTHTAPFILSALLLGIGGLLTFPPLGYLYRAAKARVPISRLGLLVAAAGAVGYGVGQGLSLIATAIGASDFAGGTDKSNEAATDALSNPTAAAARLVAELGGLSLAVAFVIIALAAMRAGLLNRFLGILGAIVGASLVLPLDQLGIIRSFWMGALGMLILGVRRRPKAWSVAEAVPWPSQQQVREQREAARRAREGQRDGTAPANDAKASRRRAERVPQPRAPEPRRAEPTGARPHSASKKRKRKRRS